MHKCITWSEKRCECSERDAEVHHMECEAVRVWRKRCISAAHGARSGASAAKEMQKCITWSEKRCECGERDAELHLMEREVARLRRKRCKSASHGA
ncbi:hypothetical protein [Paenibacillus castaneae]|uniref:hypothetical protein n=1 Tax=Paenibacillus castaneae TaxID=474957 RepID=UPI001ABA07BA|nr:hypothetical protein [Paenibacillus castaneae]